MRMTLIERVKHAAMTAAIFLFGEFKAEQRSDRIIAREFHWKGHIRTVYLVRSADPIKAGDRGPTI